MKIFSLIAKIIFMIAALFFGVSSIGEDADSYAGDRSMGLAILFVVAVVAIILLEFKYMGA